MHAKALVRAPDGYSHMRAVMHTMRSGNSTKAIVGLHLLGWRTCAGRGKKPKDTARIPSILLFPHGPMKYTRLLFAFMRSPSLASVRIERAIKEACPAPTPG